jgi:arsenite methyltransferase
MTNETSTVTQGAELREIVKAKYGEAARRVRSGEGLPAECCTSTTCCGGAAAASCNPITANLYGSSETAQLPPEAVLASLGCGNPTALAELHEGETVLDLGSGGGIDVLLSAKRVGPTGKAYGLDMTDEMLALARENAQRAGVTNVEFLKGEIEAIPLPDNSVDVIISNCVINLAGDKRRVLAEAFRVLKPGGRFAVSDVVVRGALPPELKRSLDLWVGCVAGALEEEEFTALLRDAGFVEPSVEMTRTYDVEDARAFLAGAGVDVDVAAREISGRVGAAFVRARKPVAEQSEPVIRAARPSDLAAVERLLAASGLPLDGVREALSTFVVAERAGEILGVGGLEVCRDDALLRSVTVAPGWRGRGLGRTLVERLIALAQSRGIRALYLLTTTAEHYFPRFNFVRTSRDAVPPAVRETVEFRRVCPDSAVVMYTRRVRGGGGAQRAPAPA